MRLIDADRVSEIIYENVPAPYEDSRKAKEECLRIIEEALTIDAVPVVRCRDCAWFADNNNGEWYGCWLFNAIRAGDNKPTLNDYCSYGERKDRTR